MGFLQFLEQLHTWCVVGSDQNGVWCRCDENRVGAGVSVQCDMMGVTRRDDGGKSAHDEKTIAAHREGDMTAVAKDHDARHGTALEGRMRAVLNDEGRVCRVIFHGGVVAMEVV